MTKTPNSKQTADKTQIRRGDERTVDQTDAGNQQKTGELLKLYKLFRKRKVKKQAEHL